jgi:surface antigen
MRLRFLAAALLVSTSSILAGCVSDPYTGSVTNETAGTVGGAATGAIIGAAIAKNDVAGALLGAAVGGVIGNRIGANLDEESRQRYWNAQNRALEYGDATEWSNDERGDRGTITPGRSYYQGSAMCRPYTSTVWIAGRGEQMNGTACRNPDGTWSQS